LAPPTADEANRQLLRESVGTSSGAELLVGLVAVTLGVLVIGGVANPLVRTTLVIVAALALGAGLFLEGAEVGERMPATTLRR
jgi:hypothetical protein